MAPRIHKAAPTKTSSTPTDHKIATPVRRPMMSKTMPKVIMSSRFLFPHGSSGHLLQGARWARRDAAGRTGLGAHNPSHEQTPKSPDARAGDETVVRVM